MDKKGVTLIEVMIALVVLLIVFVGLIQAALLSIDHNVRNQVRDEAVSLASEAMNNLKAESFANLSDTGGTTVSLDTTVQPGPTPSASLGNYTQNYTVKKQIHDIGSPVNNKQITVTVEYTYRSDPQVTYTINAIVVNPTALNQ